MLAVVELGGNQFIVKPGDIIEVKKQDIKENGIIKLEALLISSDGDKDIKIGTPNVKGSKVEMKVLSHKKGDKVRVFKMKSKKRNMKNKGFRQSLTVLEVLSIV